MIENDTRKHGSIIVTDTESFGFTVQYLRARGHRCHPNPYASCIYTEAFGARTTYGSWFPCTKNNTGLSFEVMNEKGEVILHEELNVPNIPYEMLGIKN